MRSAFFIAAIFTSVCQNCFALLTFCPSPLSGHGDADEYEPVSRKD